MYPTQALAQFVANFHNGPISPPLLHAAKRAVIDWYAALYPGLATAPVPQLLQVLHEDLGHGAARLATGQLATTRAAALLHGTAAHAAELDDSFKQAMYHPGAATIAATLAQAQAVGANGHEFLRAVIAGYEVSTRIGVVLGRAHYQHWHNTGTVGTFGAAAACASLLKLDAQATAHALATAATFASGLQQAFRMDSMSKPLHPGKAAESGVLAAQLAARGVTGSLDVLDGSAGFGVALSDGPQWAGVANTLGQDFHIMALTFKNHVGCGHTFAAIDAALALREQYALQPDAIEAIRVDTYQPALDIARYLLPRTENEARFSLPFVLATALVHGSVRLGAYTAERLASAPIQRLMAGTTVAVDADLDAAFPTHRGARLRITTRDGQQLEWLQSDRKGDPELPLTDAELNGKFIELAAPVLGAGQAAAQLQALWQLEQAGQF